MKTIYLLIVWFGTMLVLSVNGVFDSPTKPPVQILLAVAIPVLLYLADRPIFKGALFEGLYALENSTLVLLQTYRVVGAFFIVELLRFNLPSGFALPAGIGDVLVGIVAPLISYLLIAQKSQSVMWARWWNYLGLLDLVVALSMGITHGASALGIFAQDISMRPIGQYPLSLVPTWAVPLAIIMHLRSLSLLKQTSADRVDQQASSNVAVGT